MKRLDCEYHLRPGEGELQTEIGRGSGPIALGARLGELLELELNPRAYGELLFESLFPPGGNLRREYERARERADLEARGLRFRLYLDERLTDEERDLAWERIYDKDCGALARLSGIAFSRFLPGSHRAPALIGSPRVLAAVADPVDLPHFRLPELDRDRASRFLKEALSEKIDCDFLDQPATSTILQTKLSTGGFQALHLVAHGLPPARGEGGIVIERGRGRADFIRDDDLVEILFDYKALSLIVLVSCHSAALRKEAPFGGLAERLVRRGIPAVVAMRREITMKAAEAFAAAFYNELAESGAVDVAANAARQALFADPDTRDEWSNVVLFLGSQEGTLWRKPEPRSKLGALGALLISLSLWISNHLLPEPSDPGGEEIGSTVPANSVTKPEGEDGGSTTVPPRENPPKPAGDPSLPSAIPQEVLQNIDKAQRYLTGGIGNTEQSLRCYREALAKLPDGARRSLDQHRLAKAKTLPASEAVKEYGALLDPLLQSSSTDVTQGGSNQ